MTQAVQSPGPAAAEDALPYRLEIWDRAGERPTRVIAQIGSPGVAYAAYYAALREFFGENVKLIRDGRVVISSGPLA